MLVVVEEGLDTGNSLQNRIYLIASIYLPGAVVLMERRLDVDISSLSLLKSVVTEL